LPENISYAKETIIIIYMKAPEINGVLEGAVFA
jgi:hypothetical protein